MSRQVQVWIAVTLVAVLIALSHHGRRWLAQSTEPRLSANRASEWMVDALPGIGPATRAEMLVALRAGDTAALPKTARPMAAAVFRFDEGSVGTNR